MTIATLLSEGLGLSLLSPTRLMERFLDKTLEDLLADLDQRLSYRGIAMRMSQGRSSETGVRDQCHSLPSMVWYERRLLIISSPVH